MQIMVTISKGCVCVKWDNPYKTLSTVPGTAMFIKCYHSLIPKDTQTFRDSDLDSAMFCPSFHIPQCFNHLLKKSPFQGFPLQTDLVRTIPRIFSLSIHWSGKQYYLQPHLAWKKSPYMNRSALDQVDKRWVCRLFVIADITIINFWFKWHGE